MKTEIITAVVQTGSGPMKKQYEVEFDETKFKSGKDAWDAQKKYYADDAIKNQEHKQEVDAVDKKYQDWQKENDPNPYLTIKNV